MTQSAAARVPAPAATAKRENAPLPQALVARQAIYDRSKEVIAYELLYRRSETAQTAKVVDGVEATLQVITNSALEIGLDRLAGDVPVHINYPSELLARRLMLPVTAKRVVVEVLEDVRATPEVLGGIMEMRNRGHQIALDDFSPAVSDMALLKVAHIVKLDVSQYSADQLQKAVVALKARGLKLVAERIETVADFDRCVALGFDSFQGYFLQHPQTFSAKPVPANKLGTLRLVAVLQSDDSSIGDVERMIAQDVSLSYRVLRCINSSYYGFSKKIESIRQAVVILGFEKLRQLCALIALRALEDRPPSMFIDAMTRARLCERIGQLRGGDGGSFFITGLFSTLDVLTGIPMKDLLKELPLTAEVAQALTTQDGRLGVVLREVMAYERGTWTPSVYSGIAPETMQTEYLEAIAWAESTQALVSG